MFAFLCKPLSLRHPLACMKATGTSVHLHAIIMQMPLLLQPAALSDH